MTRVPALTPRNPTGIARPDFISVRTRLPLAFLLALLLAPSGMAHAQPADEEAEDEVAADDDDGGEDEAPTPPPNPYEPVEDEDEGVSVSTMGNACQGRRIIRIMVEGARRVAADDILATMRLSSDVPCTENEVTRDARSLWELGFFDDIIIEAEPVGPNVVLVVRVRERPEIRSIVFEGNDEIDDEDIEEEISIREGTVLSPSDVREQVDKIRDHYASEGYFLSRVTYELREVDNDQNQVDVVFSVDEGPAVKVRRITLVGNQNISTADLHAIMATGETGFFSFITDSDTFDREKFDEDVMRLQAWYYDQGYLAMSVGTPRIELTADREYIDITIPIDEAPASGSARSRSGRSTRTATKPSYSAPRPSSAARSTSTAVSGSTARRSPKG